MGTMSAPDTFPVWGISVPSATLPFWKRGTFWRKISSGRDRIQREIRRSGEDMTYTVVIAATVFAAVAYGFFLARIGKS